MQCQITKQNEVFVLIEGHESKVLQAAWFPERPNNVYSNIVAEKTLPYLTSMEADLTLLNYFRALKVGGQLLVTVPDADYFMRMWMQADWNEENIKNANSDCRHAFAGLWGMQVSGNPRNDNYSEQHSDVYKSAYNQKRLAFLLERAGFVDVSVNNDNAGNLTATAIKSMNKGERQVATDYSNIRQDHKNRYQFACDILASSHTLNILDCACGIGYGSLMLSKATQAKVTGVDIDNGAINYAKQYYSGEGTNFICQDARELGFGQATFDTIISFETIEHVPFDEELICQFYNWLAPRGRLICSTPNQETLPFSKNRFPYHIKHYTNAELVALLKSAGFTDIELFTQRDYSAGLVEKGDDGFFTIAVAIK